MTRYLLKRPEALPEYPCMTVVNPTAAMRLAARTYLQTAGCAPLADVDMQTSAYERPGIDEDEIVTDCEYAQRVLDAPVNAAHDPAASRETCRAESQANWRRRSNRDQALRPPWQIGRLAVGRGVAVANSQTLRSPIFSTPTLGEIYSPIADRSSYELTAFDFALTQAHADVLLYLTSRVVSAPALGEGAVARFSRRGLLVSAGRTVNSESYRVVESLIDELCLARFSFVDRARPNIRRIHREKFTERLRAAGTSGQCEVALSAGYCELLAQGRNTVIDLSARAAIRGNFRKWLQAFVTSQAPGQIRRYDVSALCAAGGLAASRDSAMRSQLRDALAALSGQVKPASTKINPVIAPGWAMHKDSGRWVLELARK